jgi:hypothetical protein
MMQESRTMPEEKVTDLEIDGPSFHDEGVQPLWARKTLVSFASYSWNEGLKLKEALAKDYLDATTTGLQRRLVSVSADPPAFGLPIFLSF